MGNEELLFDNLVEISSRTSKYYHLTCSPSYPFWAFCTFSERNKQLCSSWVSHLKAWRAEIVQFLPRLPCIPCRTKKIRNNRITFISIEQWQTLVAIERISTDGWHLCFMWSIPLLVERSFWPIDIEKTGSLQTFLCSSGWKCIIFQLLFCSEWYCLFKLYTKTSFSLNCFSWQTGLQRIFQAKKRSFSRTNVPESLLVCDECLLLASAFSIIFR